MTATTHTSRWIETALVTASLLLYSFIAAPVPALNEPHYLAKAKHYWQPEWCAGDFFLESADAHTVFFVTVGWLTTWCPLAMTAVLGRIAALTVLAWGWTALARALETSSPALKRMPGCALWSAWIFLALATVGNWSGEWLVGGVESKVFAYGLLFWAWSQLPEGRWYRSALAIGAAIAFHPVVGLWGLLATLGTLIAIQSTRVFSSPPHSRTPALPLSLSQLAIATVIITVVSLPGLLPVVKLITEPVEPLTRRAGTYIQVYFRLKHHLDPMEFPLRAYLGYAALTVVWLVGWKWGPRTSDWRWLHGVTAWALVFALAGYFVGWGPRPPDKMPLYDVRMHILKFYPFRLADALVPLVVSLQAAGLFLSSRTAVPASGSRRLCEWGVLLTLATGTLYFAHRAVENQRYARAHDADWRDVCEWIRENTEVQATVIPPHGQWTFRWYGERPEFVNFKDCPQDARGIVEWNRRQLVLKDWYGGRYADERYSFEELLELGRLTSAEYLIADDIGPFEAVPTYQNASYRVYDLHQPDQTK